MTNEKKGKYGIKAQKSAICVTGEEYYFFAATRSGWEKMAGMRVKVMDTDFLFAPIFENEEDGVFAEIKVFTADGGFAVTAKSLSESVIYGFGKTKGGAMLLFAIVANELLETLQEAGLSKSAFEKRIAALKADVIHLHGEQPEMIAIEDWEKELGEND
ncbi:hypothetical protein [Listeria ilorinensis]|uniref:hypothetical protein n=1 Tax=Listeria ilorinensis TaxID=2867439 RepID=UPI001EF5D0BB|nr:hypothetical protein [Listeria ilorinensis]